MDIIVTGEAGSGKTAVCQKVIGMVRDKGYTCGGVVCRKAALDNIVVIDLQSGEKETLAGIDDVWHGPRVGKHFYNPAGIEFAVKAIEKGVGCDFLFVDEIGHLELKGEGFASALRWFGTERANSAVAVVRKELLEGFSSRFGLKPAILEASRDNRDELPQIICSYLFHNFLQLIEGG